MSNSEPKFEDDRSDWEDNGPLSAHGEFGVTSKAAARLKGGLNNLMVNASNGEGDFFTED